MSSLIVCACELCAVMINSIESSIFIRHDVRAGVTAGIGALTNLRELRVSGNKLAGLTSEIGSLRKLHRLVADSNLLTSIPGSSCHNVFAKMCGMLCCGRVQDVGRKTSPSQPTS